MTAPATPDPARGAQTGPHLGTQIENARAAVEKGGDEMHAAERRYERLCDELTALEAQQSSEVA